ncbi:MAG: RnfABCDGE type electron transport complex subunit D [Pseudomonadota bacterium]
MSDYIPAPSPHTHGKFSLAGIMVSVWLALLPASLYGVWLYGWPALNLLLITSVSALAVEAAGLYLAGKPIKPALGDGSALVTAWLLAMTLPPWAPWWIAVIGAVFAIIVGKQVFGGIGQNLFNPAMLGRVALLIAFPLEMTTWVSPQPLFSAGAPGFSEGLAITFSSQSPSNAISDAISGASLLGHIKTEVARGLPAEAILAGAYNSSDAAIGNMRGSLGETSALLLLLGGLFLLIRRIISWHIPFTMLATVALLATVMNLIAPERYVDAGVHLLSGGLMLGAFFIATDPVGSPSSAKGQIVYAVGCGALIYIIRTWAGFPEGVAFAVLLMNAATPLIDHYMRPRIYGRNRQGEPLDYESGKFAKRLSQFQRGND